MTDHIFWPETATAVAAETAAAAVAWKSGLDAHAVRDDWMEVRSALGFLTAVAEKAADGTRSKVWPHEALPHPDEGLCVQFFLWVEKQTAQFELVDVAQAAADVAHAAQRIKG